MLMVTSIALVMVAIIVSCLSSGALGTMRVFGP